MTGPEFEQQKAKDLAVLTQICRHSDVSKPHRIEHHFFTESRTGGTELREWARLNGFEVSSLQESRAADRCGHCFALVKPALPTIENIAPQTELMLRLAAEFECTYGGWGCEVVA